MRLGSLFGRSLSVLGLASLLLVAGASGAWAQDALKIAVVDLDLVVNQSDDGQALAQRLQTFQKDVQAEGDRMTQEARELREQMAAGANALSEDRMAEMQKELEDKTIAIRRYGDDKQREGEKMQNEGLKAIEAKLGPVIQAIQREQNYDLVLNKVPGVVVIAGPKVDITAQVLQRLNAYQPDSGGG